VSDRARLARPAFCCSRFRHWRYLVNHANRERSV